MTRDDLLSRLDDLCACAEARAWARATPGTPEELWSTCPRGDWLLWLAMRAGVDRRVVVLAACDCADLGRGTDGVARDLLEVARRWARGEATGRKVWDAAAEAERGWALDATRARSFWAAHAAATAAFSPGRSVAADYASMSATYAAQVGSGVRTGLLDCAILSRARIPWAAVEAALLGGAS